MRAATEPEFNLHIPLITPAAPYYFHLTTITK